MTTAVHHIKTLRQRDLVAFKALYPLDAKLQALTLEQLVGYSEGKEPDGSTANPNPNAPPAKRNPAISECQWAVGIVVVDVVCLVLGLSALRNKNLQWTEAINIGATLQADIEHALQTLTAVDSTVLAKANSVREIALLVYSGGLVEPIYHAIIKNLDWWDMVLYGVAGMAEIAAAFLTDGAAVIALLVYDLAMAGFLVTDAERAISACFGDHTQSSGLPV